MMEVCNNVNSIPISEPYRATKLWNDVIIAYRSGMPLARHRRYMKTYDDCFSASESIDWLHSYLRSNPNFGQDVTRAQTLQLLQKLHRARVVEDVRGGKHNKADISDNGRLFRFTHFSPKKKSPSNGRRVPFTERTNFTNDEIKNQPLKPHHQEPTEKISNCYLVAKRLSPSDVNETWKHITLDRLMYVLHLESLSHILDENFVQGHHVMHNCVHLNKSGIVTNIDAKDQLPHWAMSAMKCLAHWPDKVDDNLPNYPGFEKDVYGVVKDYFCGLAEPLMTYEMYEVIIKVFVTAEGRLHQYDSQCDLHDTMPESLNSFESVEKLLLDLTNVEQPTGRSYENRSTPDNQRTCRLTTSASALNLSPILPAESFLNEDHLRRSESSVFAKYETAFGPENRTVTRVYYKDGISTDYGYTNGPDELSKTPLETHFDTVPSCENIPHVNDKRQIIYDIHFARVKSMRKTSGQYQEEKRRRSCSNTLERMSDFSSGTEIDRRRTASASNNNQHQSNGRYKRNMSGGDIRMRPSISAVNLHHGHNIVPPIRSSVPPSYNSPPNYSSLFPNGYQPVLDGATKLLRRCHRSKSNASLHHSKSTSSLVTASSEYHLDQFSGERPYPVKLKPSRRIAESKESLPGRSLSMSDLMHADQNSLDRRRMHKSYTSRSSLHEEVLEKKKKSLQLVCLLLPPANRRKLHLLLKLMGKMCDNDKLQISDDQPTRAMLMETFYRAILSSQDEADMEDTLVMKIVAFLMDHSAEIMAVPNDLKVKVEENLNNMNKAQVSVADYHTERLSHSQRALVQLLEEIISDRTMAIKDKKKRLKQFQKTYPDIYAQRFPDASSENEVFPSKPKIKQPLLVRPLLKLRGLRI